MPEASLRGSGASAAIADPLLRKPIVDWMLADIGVDPLENGLDIRAYVDAVKQIESSGGRNTTGKANKETGNRALGDYQWFPVPFKEDLEAAELYYKKSGLDEPKWIDDALKHNDPRKLTSGQQEELFMIRMYRLADNEDLRKTYTGDNATGQKIYATYHHTAVDEDTQEVMDKYLPISQEAPVESGREPATSALARQTEREYATPDLTTPINSGMLSEITDLPSRRGGGEILNEVVVPQLGGRIPEVSVPKRSGRFPEASVDARRRSGAEILREQQARSSRIDPTPPQAPQLEEVVPTQRGQIPIPQPRKPAPAPKPPLRPESEPRLESELAASQIEAMSGDPVEIEDIVESAEPVKVEASKLETTFERKVTPEKVERLYESRLPSYEEAQADAKRRKEANKAQASESSRADAIERYKSRLPEVEHRPSNESANAVKLRRGLRTVGQGLTAGTGDELEAGLTALFSDTSYGDARAGIMKDLEDQRAVSPTTALFQDVGGGLLSGGALVSQLVKRGASATTAGALEGGLMGAGYGEGIEGKALGAVGFAAFGGTVGKAVDWATTPSSKPARSSVQGGKTKIDESLDESIELDTDKAIRESGQEEVYVEAKVKPRQKVLRPKIKTNEKGEASPSLNRNPEFELQDLTWRNAQTAGEFWNGVKYLAKDFYDQKLTPASEYVMRNAAPRVGAIFQRYSETALRANTIALKTVFEPMNKLITRIDDDKMLKAMIMDYTNQSNLIRHNEKVARARQYSGVELKGPLEQSITTKDQLQRYITANYGADEWAKFDRYLAWNKDIKQKHVQRLSGVDEFAQDGVEHIHTRKMKKKPEDEPKDIMEEFAMRDDDALEGRTRMSMVDDLNNGQTLNRVDQYFNPLLTDFRRTSNLEVLNQMARLFNLKRPAPGTQPTAVFDELYETLIQRGLSKEKAELAVKAMKDDFIGQSKTPNDWLQFLNSWGYAGSLAGPKSAVLNFHDVPMAAVIYGPGSFKGVFKEMGYKVSEKGIVQNVGEFQNYVNEKLRLGQKDLAKELADKSREGTDILMRYSGFAAADGIGKQAITKMIIQDAVDNVDNLAERWGFYFSDAELKAIQNQIRKHGTDVASYTGPGKELMEELFFAGLGQQQLISSAGRPLAWSRNPNFRFMWALRGFAMKQLALAHRNIYDNIAKGNNKAAWDYMKRYALFSAGTFGLLNESRQWFFGDGEFTAAGVLMGMGDQIISTASINTIGLNDYQWGKMMQEGVTITFIKSLEPLATSIPRSNIGDLVEIIDNPDDLQMYQKPGKLLTDVLPIAGQTSRAVDNVTDDLAGLPGMNPLNDINKRIFLGEQGGTE